MAIPDFQSIMLPLLKYLGDEKERHIRETIEALARQFNLFPEERKELLPSGQQYTFDNRVGWARTHMKKAGLIETTRRGYFKITAQGLRVLRENPKEINVQYLKKFPEFMEFQALKREKEELREEEGIEDEKLLTPEEEIESAYQRLRQNLAAELIQQVRRCSPSFFQRIWNISPNFISPTSIHEFCFCSGLSKAGGERNDSNFSSAAIENHRCFQAFFRADGLSFAT